MWDEVTRIWAGGGVLGEVPTPLYRDATGLLLSEPHTSSGPQDPWPLSPQLPWSLRPMPALSLRAGLATHWRGPWSPCLRRAQFTLTGRSVGPPHSLVHAARCAQGSGRIAVAAISLHVVTLATQAGVHEVACGD